MAQLGNIDTVCKEAVRSLEDLQRDLPKAEDDRLPKQTVTYAVESLEKFANLAEQPDVSQDAANQRGKLLELVRMLNPSALTGLGAQQAEMAGLLRRVEDVLLKKNPNEVEGTGFYRLR